MTPRTTFTVLCSDIDGGAYRLLKLTDGSGRVENWGPNGWVPGAAGAGEVLLAPPVGRAFAKELGIPFSDLKSQSFTVRETGKIGNRQN